MNKQTLKYIYTDIFSPHGVSIIGKKEPRKLKWSNKTRLIILYRNGHNLMLLLMCYCFSASAGEVYAATTTPPPRQEENNNGNNTRKKERKIKHCRRRYRSRLVKGDMHEPRLVHSPWCSLATKLPYTRWINMHERGTCFSMTHPAPRHAQRRAWLIRGVRQTFPHLTCPALQPTRTPALANREIPSSLASEPKWGGLFQSHHEEQIK